MFGLMKFGLSRFGMYRWLLDANKDGGTGAGTGKQTDDSTGGTTENAGKDKPATEKVEVTFTEEQQRLVDKLVGDARTKEREKSRLELQQESEKAKKKAEQEALEQKEEWKTLAETRADEIVTLTKDKEELLPFKEKAEKYEKALNGMLAETKKGLAKHLLPLLDKMDPIEALEYITKNAKELNIKAVVNYPETPEEKERTITKDEETSGQQANQRVISSSF